MKNERKIVFCLAFAAFTFQFEAFVVNVALPTIADDLDITTTYVSFIVLVYLITATSTFLPAGRLGDAIGLKRTFIGACFLSAIGTLLCGLAFNHWMLFGSRFIQGIGAGGMAALGYAMIPAWLAQDRVGWGYGYLSMGAGLGMLAGVPAGGVLSHFTSWQWIFLGNVPPMTLLLIFAWRYLPGDHSVPQSSRPSDPLGAILFSGILAATIFGISLGDELGWGSLSIRSAFALAAGMIAALACRGRLAGRPYFPPEILGTPGFAASLVVLFLTASVFGGINFLMPFYLEEACSFSAILSSAILLAHPAMYALTAPQAGRHADKIGPGRLVVTATLLGATACGSFAMLLSTGKVWIAVLFLLLLGMARGMFFAPNNRFTMARAPAERRGEAASLLPVALNMGTIFGVSIFETVFSMNFPVGAACWPHCHRDDASMLLDTINQGFSRAFLLALSIFLAAMTISFLAYPKTMEDDHGKG